MGEIGSGVGVESLRCSRMGKSDFYYKQMNQGLHDFLEPKLFGLVSTAWLCASFATLFISCLKT